MKRRLRLVLVCLAVCLYRFLSCHVHCSVQMSMAPLLPLQDSSQQEEPKEGQADKVEVGQGANIQSSYELEVAKEETFLQEASQQDSTDTGQYEQAARTEESVAVVKKEPVSDPERSLKVNVELEPDAFQDKSTAFSTEATPENAVSAPEDIVSTPTSQASSTAPTSEVVVPGSIIPLIDSVDAEQSTTDCDTGEAAFFEKTQPSILMGHTTENSSSNHTKGQQASGDVNLLLGRTDENVTRQSHGGNTSHTLKEGVRSKSTTDVDPSVPNKDHGDIPTFDEWKKKMMEVEKEKSLSTHTPPSGNPATVKKVQKNLNNYASVECGAKILCANIEAKSTSAILMENMDLYMLNPCSNKIWFVIELCEPIQVKQLDIANFELFSSTPKDFLVSISDRYPTNKWVKLGTFHARDERTVQSFPLNEHLYAKYVKIELVSHFGSEHFCPLSLIRVFGTSMVEEYEEIAESQYPAERLEYLDEDYGKMFFFNYPVGYIPREDKSSKNLIGSATNAILNMVNNIAANVLGAKTELEESIKGGANISTEELNVTETLVVSELIPTSTSLPMFETVEPGPPPPLEKPEASVTEASILAPSEVSQIVILVQEEEDPSPSPITLLEREEQEMIVEPEKNQQLDVKQMESLVYCGDHSSVSCTASLQEYLRLWCSFSLALQRQSWKPKSGQEMELDAGIPQHLPISGPSQPLELLTATEPPTEKEPVSVQIETDTMQTPVPPADLTIGHVSEPTQLEPSQSISLPLQTFTDPRGTKEVSFKTCSNEMSEQDFSNFERLPEMEEDEKRKVPSISKSGSSAFDNSISIVDEPTFESDSTGQGSSIFTVKDQPIQVLLTATRPSETPPATEVSAVPSNADTVTGAVGEPQRSVSSKEPPEGLPLTSELKVEDSVEDILNMPSSIGQFQRTATDFYAELQNSSDLAHANGNQVHGSNQKESVFMRLSNRIKALEMNMSLSSRYLEELSQRYRKQMEEMQRAFNKTIIKLQNTSKVAEEQDQRQTEYIQLLQNQLENVTQLVLNLSTTVYKLQKEVSDRQCYLVVCLVLSVCLWLVLCAQCSRSIIQPPPDPDSSVPQTTSYPSPKRHDTLFFCLISRCFSSYDDLSLMQKMRYSLVRSKSIQLPTTERSSDLYIVEPLQFSPENKKKKRCKMKAEKIETVRSSDAVPSMANGGLKFNGNGPPYCYPPQRGGVNMSTLKDTMSEGSSEGSSHSEDSYFCGISACARLCDSQPPPKSKVEKRASKRRHSRLPEGGEHSGALLQRRIGTLPALRDLMKRGSDASVGGFRAGAVSSPI
ncbi:SUN domain-containing ossification factor-like isoform X2 [Arapaima gigas]